MQIMHRHAKVVVLCRLTMSNLPFRVVSTIVSRNHRPRRYVSRWLGFFFLIRKMLLSLASSLNSVPLPPVSNRYGIRLPAPEHCLTNVNFSIVPDPPPDVQFGHSFVRPSTGPQESRQDSVPSGAGDTPMADGDENESHGVKRVLEEDEDYD